MVPGHDHDLCGRRQLLLGNPENRAVEFSHARVVLSIFFHRAFPPVVLGNRDLRIDLLGDLSRFNGGYRVNPTGQWDQKNIDLAHHLELGRGEGMTQVPKMRDADIVHPKNEDRVFTSLKSLALVMVRGNGIDRNVPDARVNRIPIFPAGGEPFENDRIPCRHPDVTVSPVLVAGGDNVLRERGPREIIPTVGIREDPSSLGRSDLESGMAEPLQQNRGGGRGGRPEERCLNRFDLVAEAQGMPGQKEPPCQNE